MTAPSLSCRSAVMGMTALAAAAGLPRPLAAKSFTLPVVDRLTLTIVTDNAVFGPFLPDLDRPGLKLTRGGSGNVAGSQQMSPKPLMAEFGLSILAESTMASASRRVLVDFGYSREVLSNNLAILGIDPASIDATALSHGHLDHYGGIPAMFGEGASALPFYVGGEEAFCERIAMVGNPPQIMGRLDRASLAAAGMEVRVTPEPAAIAGHGFVTGVIPLESSERPAIPTRMRPGLGCERDALRADKRTGDEVADDGEHELATCYAIKGLGLVVIASCSHRGVLNSVRRAQAISGIDKVHMVIGGFHLVRPRTEDEARGTAAALKSIDPTYVVPMHCSGEVFIAEALRIMPDKVIRSYVGTRLTMAAA